MFENVILFWFEADFAGRAKARPADRNLAGDGQRRAFTPAVILFIALPDAKGNIEPGWLVASAAAAMPAVPR